MSDASRLVDPVGDVERFVSARSSAHPELRPRVTLAAVHRIARREGIQVRTVPLSEPARLLHFRGEWEIQIAEGLDTKSRTFHLIELIATYWRVHQLNALEGAAIETRRYDADSIAGRVAVYLTRTAARTRRGAR